jgi:phosphoribosyl 1,2-cyclic phosphate phosphodiesterase
MAVKFTILGCGSSLGIPRIDGNFGKCNSKNIKNYRTRCSALISSSQRNILIDTSPDIKFQLLKNKIKNINNVFYTHPHADQTHGINELRAFYIINKKKLPVYADNQTKKYLLSSFKYCFKDTPSYPATLKFNNLNKIYIFDKGKNKIIIKNITVKHGLINSKCYIINNKCAYASDVNKIYNKDIIKLKNLKYFVVDCLRFKYHPSHFNLSDVFEITKKIKPKKTILTNLHSDVDYNDLKNKLPKNIIPAYDGLSFLI